MLSAIFWKYCESRLLTSALYSYTPGQWWAAKIVKRKQLFFLRPSQTAGQFVIEKTNWENYKEKSWHWQKLYRFWLLPFGLMCLRYSTAGQLECFTVWHCIKCILSIDFVVFLFFIFFYWHLITWTKVEKSQYNVFFVTEKKVFLKELLPLQHLHVWKGESWAYSKFRYFNSFF